ncbi:MAG: type II toxin-antitoxin system RelE/ParE family toxin [Candidatus Gracilibacteria bacterium]|jgi:mRNA interferase RelE/StbE
MRYQTILKPAVEKELKKLDKKNYYRLLATLSNLSNNPFLGKKLRGEFEGYYSFRVWPYRIIYQILKNELIVLVIHIGHRQNVYK